MDECGEGETVMWFGDDGKTWIRGEICVERRMKDWIVSYLSHQT